MKILVIEDEGRIAAFVRRGLEAEGFAVGLADDGEQGLRAALAPGVSLVLLDLVLPGLSGEEVLRRLRAQRPELPVIVLSAKDAISDRVSNLEAGADDYVIKPFSFAELLARIHTRLRLADPPPPDELRHGDLELDPSRREVSLDGRVVGLSAREAALLEALIRHPGEALSSRRLLSEVWGPGLDAPADLVGVYVGALRRKLGPQVIEEVDGGRGYRLAGAAAGG